MRCAVVVEHTLRFARKAVGATARELETCLDGVYLGSPVLPVSVGAEAANADLTIENAVCLLEVLECVGWTVFG